MREIKLNKGFVALVDDEDFEWLNKVKWQARKCRSKIYAGRRTSKKAGKMISMHRLIMNPPPNLQIDHRNGNGLDNRRFNLRICTSQQNNMNRGKRPGSSKYRGVCLKNNKWVAQIKKDGKYYFLGSFYDESNAARLYDQAARELFGEFANPNFPQEQNQRIDGKQYVIVWP